MKNENHLSYIPQLDGLRAIAILMVIIAHYIKNATWPIQAEYFPEIYLYISWFWAGVDLFFVLSGFLIGRILLFNKGSNNYFKAFYARRFLRIFPAYYFIIVLFIVFDAFTTSTPFLTGQHPPIITFFFFIQNFFFHIPEYVQSAWLAVTWSLAIEEQFYLILPLVVFLVPRRAVPYICVAGILLAPVFRYISPPPIAHSWLFTRMDSLLCGVLIAHYHLSGKTKFNQWYLVGIVTLGLLIIRQLLIYTDFERMGRFWYTYSVFAFFFSVLLLFAINSRGIFQRFFTLRPLLFIGKISYMMYLTHQIFNGALHYYLNGETQPIIRNWTEAGISAGALALCIVFCVLSRKYFEVPILNLGRRFTYKRKELPVEKQLAVVE